MKSRSLLGQSYETIHRDKSQLDWILLWIGISALVFSTSSRDRSTTFYAHFVSFSVLSKMLPLVAFIDFSGGKRK